MAIIFFYFFVNSSYVEELPACYIRENFHVICPSCGGTRCVTNFVKGNFQQAFQYNPIIFIMICYLLFINSIYVIDTIRNKKNKYLYPKWWYFVIWAFILIGFSVIRNIWNIYP